MSLSRRTPRPDHFAFPPGKYLPHSTPTTVATSAVFVPTCRLDRGGIQVMAKVIAQHVLGSHVGWTHDYGGAKPELLGQSVMQPLLERYFNAIEAVTRQKITEYA